MRHDNDVEVLSWAGPIHAFSFAITGYQFPSIDHGYDANWLNVDVVVNHGSRIWRRRSACLLTYELQELATWLARVQIREPPVSVRFLEPDMRFDFRTQDEDDAYVIDIDLRDGCVEKAMCAQHLTLHVDALGLRRAIANIDVALERFPPRGKLG